MSVLASSFCLADSYPDRSLKIIVAGAAGSTQDINARKVGDKLSRSLGQPVIIDNRPGAAGILGADVTAKSKPDRYTIFMGGSNTICINPVVYSHLPYNAARDFIPVTLAAVGSPLLVIDPSLPVKTLAEFIQYVKQRPGKLSYGSPGVGTPQHLAMELFKRLANIDIVHVPYKSSPQIVTDLMGGQIQATIEFPSVVSSQVLANKIRALAIVGPKRKPIHPDVPTSAEAGMPGLTIVAWNGYFVPAGTPKEIVARLNKDLASAAKSPDYVEWLASLGSESVGNSSAEFAAFIQSENERWRKLVKDANVHIEE